MPSTWAVHCTQNKYTSISIHTFVRYGKEVSGYELSDALVFFVSSNKFGLHFMGCYFFEVIILSDAESREEQNDASHFLIGATTAKLWPLF